MHRPTSDPATEGTEAKLRKWLCAYLSEELRLPPDAIDPEQPMALYGLDSVRAITLITEAEDHIGCALDPNALWEYPTVTAFAGLLAKHTAAGTTARDAT